MTSTSVCGRPVPPRPGSTRRVRRGAARPACASSRSPAAAAFPAPSPCRWRRGVTLTATAVVMLGGGPGEVGGPSSAAAITQALHWLSPPAGTILHVRSVETQGGRTTTREFWQSADHPESARLRVGGSESYETAGENRYDPATDTIHLGGAAEAIGKPAAAAGPCPPAIRSSRRSSSCSRTAASRSPAARSTTGPRRGRSPSGPTPAGPCGSSGWRPPTASRWSCATPVATRTRPRRSSAGRPTRCCAGAGARKLLTLKGAHPTADVVRDGR